MNTIIVKTNDATQTVAQVQVVTKDGKPTIIKAMDKVNYEFHDAAIGRAPNHIITKRLKNDLHISFEEDGKESDLIIEGFYDEADSALLGIAEDGEYYYYIPDTGETYDYVTQLETGDVEGQALGGTEYIAAAIPWWIPAAAGLGLAGLVLGLSSGGGDDKTPVNREPTATNDTVLGETGQPVIIDVVANDKDPENDLDPTSVKLIDPVTGDEVPILVIDGEGEWSVNATTGEVTFTPETGFTADPTPVNYIVSDKNGEKSNEATITVDYPGIVSISGIASLNETTADGSANEATYTVSISNPSTEDTVVTVVISNGTTEGSEDYTAPVTQDVTIPAGQTSVDFTVTMVDDSVFEGPEDFNVTVSAVTVGAATIDANKDSVTTTIYDDGTTDGSTPVNPADPSVGGDKPVVSIAATVDKAVEGKDGDTIIFTVSQTGDTVLDSSVTATLNLGDIDATDIDSITLTDTTGTPVSYTVAEVEAGISVSIPAGATSMPFFTITPKDDAIYEKSEDFSITISNPTNATIGTSSDTGTILDEDQADNSLDNPNNPNDPADLIDGDKPTVTVDDASITEGGDLVHTVTVNGVTETPVTYPFSLTNGSNNPAEAGTDYTNAPVFSDPTIVYDSTAGTITVPAGVTSFTVTYPTANDNILENDETTTLTIGNDSGTGTITDAANAIPVVSIEATDAQAIEGVLNDTIVFTVSQTGDTDFDSSVIATLNLGDIDAADIDSITLTDTTGTPVSYTVAEALAGISVAIPAGTAAADMPTFTITPTEDAIYEVSEDFGMTISNPINAIIGTDSDSATISDESDNATDPGDGSNTDGDKPTVTVDDASITEGGDLVHNVTVNGVTEADVTYDFDLSNGSTKPADAGTDYSTNPADIAFSKGVTYDSSTGTITVPAGVTSFTVTYPTANDNILENDETTTLTIGNDSGTGTILNDDVAPTIEIVNEDAAVTPADNSVTEGTSAIITGTINITNPQSVTTLTVGGVDVTSASSTPGSEVSIAIPNSNFGTLVVTNYDATTGILTYEYTEDGDAENHTAGDISIVDTFTVALTDTIGGTKTDTLDIQIIDTAPTANSDTNAITEDVDIDGSDKIIASGDVIAGTPNVSEADTLGADATTVTAVQLVVGATTTDGDIGVITSGQYGDLTLNANGTYTYVVDNTAAYVQSLAKGEKLIETFNYTITDADGDESSTTLTITITGTNDTPTITNTDIGFGVIETAAITEQTDDTAITRTGTISFADTDTTDEPEINAVASENIYSYGDSNSTFTDTTPLTPDQKVALDGIFSVANDTGSFTDGTWNINASSTVLDFIPAGETITIRYAVQVNDGENVTTAADGNELSTSEIRYVEVTITGTDDSIALVADTASTNEDTILSVTAANGIFKNDTADVDVNTELTVESYIIDGMTGTFNVGDVTNVTIDGETIGELTINTDGSYTFDPVENFSGTVPEITITVNNGPNAATPESGTETLTITVNPVSDAPDIGSDQTGNDQITTDEDTTVALNLQAPIIKDANDLDGTGNATDSPERIGLITLTGIPDGANLNYGGINSTDNTINADGNPITIFLTDSDIFLNGITEASADHSMTIEEFEKMTLTPPEDDATNISFEMSVTEYEVDNSGNVLAGVDGAESTVTIDIDVQAVTDASGNNQSGDNFSEFGYQSGATNINAEGDTLTVTVNEGESVDLPITTNFGDLVGRGGSLETYGFVISGLQPDAVVSFTPAGGSTVTEYTVDTNGQVLIGVNAASPTSTSLRVNGGSEPQISIKSAEYNSQDMSNITVSLYTQDHDTDSSPRNKTVELIDTVNVNLTVDAVAGQVTANNVSTTEDNAITLDEFGFTVLDTQDGAGAGAGAETITQIQFELPAGWTFTDNTGAATEVGGIVTIDMTGSPNLSQITLTPPAQSSTDADFTFTVTTSDPDDNTGTAVTGTAELTQKVTVTPVAETTDTGVTINPSHAYEAITASEDTAFALNQGGFDLSAGWFNPDDTTNFGEESHTTDANDSEETYAHLTFGSRDSNDVFTATEGAVFTYNDGTQDISLTDSGSGVDIPAAYLDTVTVTPPADYSDFNLDAGSSTAVKVEAVTIDYDEDTNSSVTATSGKSYLTFTVEGVADITTLGVDPATGLEDQAIVGKNERDGSATATVDPINGIPLSIRPSSRDDDGSEVYNVTITDIPAGAQLYVDNGGAITQLTISGGSVTISDYTNAVDNLYFVPAENYSGTVNLKVSAVSVENGNEGTASSVLNLPITVVGQADLILNDELKTVYTLAESVLDKDSNLIPLSGFFSDASAITPYDGDVPTAEQVTYKVTGVPIGFDITGAVFLGGSGESRSWSVSLEALQDGSAQLVTPDNFAGEVDFTITGTTTETVSGNSATHDTQTVSLVVTPDAADGVVNDPQVLAVEDTWTAVNFVAAFSSGDTTAPANIATGYEALETITLRSNDLMGQNVALRVDGVEVPLVADQTYTYNANQTIEVMYDDDKRHSDDDVTIPFDYTYTDTASLTDDSTISSTSQTGRANINVTFQAVTDAPNIELDVTDNTIVISSANDNNSASVIVSLSSDDQDDSESFTRLEITDVPAGIIVEGGILSGGTWYVDVPDTAITDTASTYTLVLTRDPNTADTPTGNITVTVTGITQDINGEGLNGSEARVSDSFIINLSRDGTGENPIDPELIATLATKPPLSQTEDGAFKLSDVINAELETGTASTVSSYSFSLTDLPEGVLLNSTNSAVTVQQIGGQWLVSVDNANGLTPNEALAAVTLTPPVDFSTNDNSDTSQNLNFGVEFTALNNVGLETSKDIDVSVEIKPVTDFFDNNLETTVLATNEDTTVAININLTNTADGDYVSIIDGKIYLQLDESGLTKDQGTTGVLTDSNGTPLIPVTLVDGQVGGIPAGTYYVVDVADTDPTIDGINPADSITVNYTPAANEDGTAVVKVYTTHTEVSNISGHDSGTLTYEHSYDIAVAAQPDSLSIAYDDVVAKATGDEDTKIAIDYKINVVDENDTAAAITFDEVPNGYLVYYTNKSGVVVLASNNGDSDGNGNNSWSIDTNKLENVNSGAAGETNNIFIAPPENISGVVENIEMTVVNNSGMASAPLVIDLDVTPVADEIVFNPSTLLGSQGKWTTLNLNAAMVDVDGSETVNIIVTGDSLYGDVLQVETRDGAPLNVRWDLDTKTYVIEGVPYDSINNIRIKSATPYTGPLSITLETVEKVDNVIVDSLKTDTGTIQIDVKPTLVFNGTDGDDELISVNQTAALKYSGGAGNDTFIGGSGNDTLNGDAGNDTLTGGAGNDTINGGADDDTIDGGAGVDTLNGGTGNDTLIFDAADLVINGGDGIDTLLINEENTTINFGTFDSSKFESIEVIDMTGNGAQSLTNLSTSDVLDIINDTVMTDKDLIINGDSDDSVSLTATGWTNSGTTTQDGINYNVYSFSDTNGNHDLLIQTDVNTTIL